MQDFSQNKPLHEYLEEDAFIERLLSPSLLSLLLNVFLLAYVIKGGAVSRFFLALVVEVSIRNGIEFFGYLLDSNPSTVEAMFKLY